MKFKKILVIPLFFLFLVEISNADEKNIKTRSGHNSENLEPVQITISPDLLDIDKALELKSKYKIAKEFSTTTDQNLKKKKKIKYRGSAKNIFKNYVNSVVFLYYPTEGNESSVKDSFPRLIVSLQYPGILISNSVSFSLLDLISTDIGVPSIALSMSATHSRDDWYEGNGPENVFVFSPLLTIYSWSDSWNGNLK